MAGPTTQQCAALQAAVDAVNAAIQNIGKTGGPGVIIRPIANYETASGFAEIRVEITTGRLIFAS